MWVLSSLSLDNFNMSTNRRPYNAEYVHLHCKKILFTAAVRRIFAALVMEKLCLCTGTFFPAPTALFYIPIGRKKFQPWRWFFPHYAQERPIRKLTVLKL